MTKSIRWILLLCNRRNPLRRIFSLPIFVEPHEVVLGSHGCVEKPDQCVDQRCLQKWRHDSMKRIFFQLFTFFHANEIAHFAFQKCFDITFRISLVMWKTSNHAFNFAWILKSIPLTKQVYFVVFKVFQEVWQKIYHNRDDFSNKLLSLWENGKKGET